MFMLADNVFGGDVYSSRYVLFICIYVCDLCLCVYLHVFLFHSYICAENCGEGGIFEDTPVFQVCYQILKKKHVISKGIFKKYLVNKLKWMHLGSLIFSSRENIK